MTTKRKDGEESRREITKFIDEYSGKHGYSPTVREITHAVFGNTGYASTHHHLKVLKDEGYIDFVPGLFRTIRTIKKYPG